MQPKEHKRRGALPFFVIWGVLMLLAASSAPARAQWPLSPRPADLYLDESDRAVLRIEWMPPPWEVTGLRLVRGSSGGPGLNVVLPAEGPNFYLDRDWESGRRYQYYLIGWNSAERREWRSGSLYVTPCDIPAAENQTADSRVDKRWGNETRFVDHSFAQGTPYRGGLFVGHNADGSEKGRSYLKFSLARFDPSTPGERLWQIGGLYVSFLRMAKTGSLNVVARTAETDAWSAQSLVWTNAPLPLANHPTSFPASVSYDRTADPPAPPAWLRLNVLPEVEREAESSGDGVLSTILMSTREGSAGSGWAYFAKRGFIQNGRSYNPRLLYALGGPGYSIFTLTLNPSGVTGGDSAVGTIELASPAPENGVTVSLTSNDPGVAQVPASVLIGAGQTTGTFEITTNAVTENRTVTITARLGSVTRTAFLTVQP